MAGYGHSFHGSLPALHDISEHIKHIFEEGEMEETSVVRKFRTTAADKKTLLAGKRVTAPPKTVSIVLTVFCYPKT